MNFILSEKRNQILQVIIFFVLIYLVLYRSPAYLKWELFLEIRWLATEICLEWKKIGFSISESKKWDTVFFVWSFYKLVSFVLQALNVLWTSLWFDLQSKPEYIFRVWLLAENQLHFIDLTMILFDFWLKNKTINKYSN